MIIPNTDVNLATEVRDVLNDAGGKVNDDITTFFKKDANINKWAYNKPFDTSMLAKEVLFDANAEDRRAANHGFDQSSFFGQAISGLMNYAKDGKLWDYILPKGGLRSPLRLGDFRGYNTDAPVPYVNKHAAGEYFSSSNEYNISFRFIKDLNAEIEINDFTVLQSIFDNGGQYFIVAEKNGEWLQSTKISTTTGNQNDLVFDMTFTNPGTWHCLLCIGQSAASGTSNIQDRTDCAALPNGYFTFIYKKRTVGVSCNHISPDTSQFYVDDSNILHFNTDQFQFGLYTNVENNVSLQMELAYGFKMQLFDSNGYFISDAHEVYDESTYHDYNGISGVDAPDGIGFNYETKNTVTFPGIIDLTQYYDTYELQQASYVRLIPFLKRIDNGDKGYVLNAQERDNFINVTIPHQ